MKIRSAIVIGLAACVCAAGAGNVVRGRGFTSPVGYIEWDDGFFVINDANQAVSANTWTKFTPTNEVRDTQDYHDDGNIQFPQGWCFIGSGQGLAALVAKWSYSSLMLNGTGAAYEQWQWLMRYSRIAFNQNLEEMFFYNDSATNIWQVNVNASGACTLYIGNSSTIYGGYLGEGLKVSEYAHVFHTANLSCNSGVWTKCPMAGEVVDADGIHASGTVQFTDVGWCALIPAGHGGNSSRNHYFAIYKNNARFVYASMASYGSDTSNDDGSRTMPCWFYNDSATNTYDFRFYPVSGSQNMRGDADSTVSGTWMIAARFEGSSSPINSQYQEYRAAAYSIPAATWTTFPHDTEEYDPDGVYANGIVTFPVGYFSMRQGIRFNYVGYGHTSIFKNGSAYLRTSTDLYDAPMKSTGSVILYNDNATNEWEYKVLSGSGSVAQVGKHQSFASGFSFPN